MTLWWHSLEICIYFILHMICFCKLSNSPSKSQSVPWVGNFPQLQCRGHGHTFMNATVTTQPSVLGMWVPGTSGLLLDQKVWVMYPASLMWPCHEERPGHQSIGMIFEKAIGRRSYPMLSALHSPFFMPRLCGIPEIGERESLAKGVAWEYANWHGGNQRLGLLLVSIPECLQIVVVGPSPLLSPVN